ncbi:PilZ domain-containing protein [Sphingomonas sp. CBMAI 2297]|uniref:PilZ domain-containing protein n=1 Tax=Sphingomonas sp. CBMAI 2297 TaxID=2991720 RepID=UPI00245741A8|nr:PilZ domain-containing protein [Sphingomonas sp. CBMAI 2297]MDH4744788.1 PilZ domain-containing protein [Sphingomonas sp. CBMAI 2297]
MLVAKLEILGDIDRRGAIRFDTDSPSTLRTPDGGPIDVQVEDFSRTGFRFSSELDLPEGTLVSLGLSGAGSRAAKVVRRSGNTYGCAFMKALTEEEIAHAFRGQEHVLADLSAALAARFGMGKPHAKPGIPPLRRLIRRPTREG